MTLSAEMIAISVGVINLCAYIVTIVIGWGKFDKRVAIAEVQVETLQTLVTDLVKRDRENATVHSRLDNHSGMLKNMQEEHLRLWQAIDQMRKGEGFIVRGK